MGFTTLTRGTFDQAVKANDLLVIEFALSSSPTAVLDSSALESLAQRLGDVAFARIDRADEPAIAAMFGLGGGPALLIFRRQVVLYVESGEHPAERVEALVRQIQALDMDAIQAAIEEEKRAETALRMRRVCPTARRGPFQAS
jgi:thioredoxin-like negative regulator of GroEL